MSSGPARAVRWPASRAVATAGVLAAAVLALLAGDAPIVPPPPPLPAPGQAAGEPPREPGAEPLAPSRPPAARPAPGGAAPGSPAGGAAPGSAAGGAAPASGGPASFRRLPAGTRQVIRVTRSTAYCRRLYCAAIEAWAADRHRRWTRVPMAGGAVTVRAQIGRNGFAGPGRKREGDGRTPTGGYTIVTTFSTDGRNPGTRMPWRQRRAGSNVSESAGPLYNTWREVPGGSGGDRPAMRYGIWVNHNHGRLVPGRGPAPVPGRGSGIFIHVQVPSAPTAPTLACVAAAPEQVAWMLRWLDPRSDPRVLLNL